MEGAEFKAGDRPEDLESVQNELDRAFSESVGDEELSALFGATVEDEPGHDSKEPGGMIDMKNLD